MDPNSQKSSFEDADDAAVPGENSNQGTSNANMEVIEAGSTDDGSIITISSDDDWSYSLNEYMVNFQATENDHADEGNDLNTSIESSSDSSLKVHPGSQSSLNLDLILDNNSGQEVNAGGASTSKNGHAEESVSQSGNSSDAGDSSELS